MNGLLHAALLLLAAMAAPGCMLGPTEFEYEGVIYGGSADAEHPAVGRMTLTFEGGGTGTCSGTAIRLREGLPARHLLTARQCVIVPKDGQTIVPARIEVSWGTTRLTGRYFTAHPIADLAIVELDGVAPVPGSDLPRVPAEAALTKGSKIVYVGFGATGTNASAGVKFAGNSKVVALDAREGGIAAGLPPDRQAAWEQSAPRSFGEHLFYTGDGGAAHCSGDSGGPVYARDSAKEVVLGVMSHGLNATGSECPAPASGNVTVAPYVAWIDSVTSTAVGLPQVPASFAPAGPALPSTGGCSAGGESGTCFLLLLLAFALLRRRSTLQM